MERYVAFLRAINVGGRGVCKMDDLRTAFDAAGARNVRTFIASGNVVFDAPARGQAALFKGIGAGVGKLLGHEPGICFRTLQEVDEVLACDPFGALHRDATVKLYVAFLKEPLRTPPALPMVSEKEALEVAAFRPREVFIVSRRRNAPGMLYGFPNNFIETLGVTATSRNWSTVTKVAAFARRAG